mmetsp:Transcript_33333/g.49687  ORF Transcript_33333/g.49687 Transcript_33333/m.49687 type:complete len:89 (+) Transcript_33333:935-1201(+)
MISLLFTTAHMVYSAGANIYQEIIFHNGKTEQGTLILSSFFTSSLQSSEKDKTDVSVLEVEQGNEKIFNIEISQEMLTMSMAGEDTKK